jgi:hypothetical protein
MERWLPGGLSVSVLFLSWRQDKFAGFIEKSDVTIALAISILVCVFGTFGICAVKAEDRGHVCALRIFIMVLFVSCMLKICVGITAVLFVTDSYTQQARTYATFGTDFHIDEEAGIKLNIDFVDNFLTDVFNFLTAYSCNAYRSCCFVIPRAGANLTATCTSHHEGQTVGAMAAALKDPSSASFCQSITGSELNRQRVGALTSSLCEMLEDMGTLDLAQCESEFCNGGVVGFQEFTVKLYDWINDNIVWFAVGWCLQGMGDSLLFVSVIFLESMARQLGRRHAVAQDRLTKQAHMELELAFDRVDTDQSGNLNFAEVKALLEEAGRVRRRLALSDEVIKRVFGRYDVNGDGVIEFDEFKVWWAKMDDEARSQAGQYENSSGEHKRLVRKSSVIEWISRVLCEFQLAPETEQSLASFRKRNNISAQFDSLGKNEQGVALAPRWDRSFASAAWSDGILLAAILVHYGAMKLDEFKALPRQSPPSTGVVGGCSFDGGGGGDTNEQQAAHPLPGKTLQLCIDRAWETYHIPRLMTGEEIATAVSGMAPAQCVFDR